MTMQRSNNSNTAFVLTIIFPFAGLVYTLNHWRESWAKNAFWLACVYLGAVLIFVPEGTILGMGADGGRYVINLMEMHNSSITIGQILGQYLKDEHTMDLYQQLLTFLISRFTDNGHVLFAAFAFVFGFFYSRNIWYVLEKLPNRKIGYLFILITLFFLINPITNINGVRYNTAVHIYIYALLPYLLEHDKSKLWWLLIVQFVHFSFYYVILFALVYVLLPNRIKTNGHLLMTVSLLLFIVSMFINAVNLSTVTAVLEEYSPESYEDRIGNYVSEDYAEANASARALTNWYVGASGIIKNWSYSILLILIYPCLKRNFKGGNQINSLYTFTLLFSALANVMSLVPSGGRFQIVSSMLKVSLFLILAFNIPQNDSFRKELNIAIVILIIPFVFDIRKLLDFFSITAVFGNFITVFFWENNVPLIDWIKRII